MNTNEIQERIFDILRKWIAAMVFENMQNYYIQLMQ